MKSFVASAFLVLLPIACSSPSTEQDRAPAAPAKPAQTAAAAPAEIVPATPIAKPAEGAPAKAGAKAAKRPTYDESAVAADQIADALARAKRDDKRVLLQWGANWCGWCNLLAATMQDDREIARTVMNEYVLVKIDVGRFDKHMDLVAKYGAALQEKGIPYLTFLDADGKVLENHETGALEDEASDSPRHDSAKVIALLKKHAAPHAEAGKLRDAAYARAKQEGKLVFQHYGAPWCGWCHRLEEWMALPEVAPLLAKQFVDLKVDIDRNAGGDAMLDAMRGGKDGGIPWFAFVDADGKVLVTSDGEKGNTGFPGAPEEIAHFRTMLEKAATKLTKAEIDALIASLAPKKKA